MRASAWTPWPAWPGKTVYGEIREHDRDGQRVVLIDMVHVGPRRFYEGIQAALGRYAGQDTLTLIERAGQCGPDAPAQVLVVDDPHKYQRSMLPQDRAAQEAWTADDVEALVARGMLKRIDCGSFASGVREALQYSAILGLPSSMVNQRNVAYRPDGVAEQSGDLTIGEIPSLPEQMVFTTVISCMGNPSCRTSQLRTDLTNGPDRGGSAAGTLLWRVLQERRNAHLLAAIQDALAAGRRIVLVPWGASHHEGYLYGALEQLGFQLQRRAQVPYLPCRPSDLVAKVLGESMVSRCQQSPATWRDLIDRLYGEYVDNQARESYRQQADLQAGAEAAVLFTGSSLQDDSGKATPGGGQAPDRSRCSGRRSTSRRRAAA